MFSNQVILNSITHEMSISDVIKCTHNGKEEYRAGNIQVRRVDDETWSIVTGEKSEKPMRRINQKSNSSERDISGWTEDKYLNDYDLIRMLHNRALKKEGDQPIERNPYFTGEVWSAAHKRPIFMNIVDNGNGTYVAYKPNSAKLNIVIKDGGEWRLAS
jgi:hypothetical protein